jgi:phosphocarrier protein HPr
MNSASSSVNRCEKELVIENELGLHARPSALFVKTTNRFKSDITVEKGDEIVNAKSIMGLMMLAAGKGTKLKVVAVGPDAAAAIAAIEEIFQKRFNEA